MLDALEPHGADPAVLTHHALGADDAARVVEYAARAGREASRAGAHRQAATFYRFALDAGEALAPELEADLLDLLGSELYLVDRLDDAIDVCERARGIRESLGDAAGLGAAHDALAIYQWYNGNRRVAEGHATRAIEVMADEEPTATYGHAWAIDAYLAVQHSDLARARACIEQARALEAAFDDRQLTARVSIVEAICDLVEAGEPARDRLVRALDEATVHFDEVYSGGFSNLATLDIEQRRFEAAATVLATSIPLTVERDVPICRAWQVGTRGRLELMRGEWSSAVADADEVLSGPSAPLARTWPHLVRGTVSLRRGLDADPDLDAAWSLACDFDEPLRLVPMATVLAERSWLAGSDDPRLDRALSVFDRAELPGLDWAAGDLAVWLQRLGRSAPRPDLLAEPHRLHLAGRHLEAAGVWESLGMPYERALELVESGDDQSVREGLDLLDRLGADAIAAKIRRGLREAGRVDVPRRRRPATRANPAGLTSRQVEVLRLLDEGLTNAELASWLFISPKTADHHVSAILTKLGVSTRAAAVDVARETGLLEGGSASG